MSTADVASHPHPNMRGRRILLLGEPPLYQKGLWTTFQSHFEIIKGEAPSREDFISALKSKRFGNFDGILKPAVESGNIPSPWDKALISLLPESCKIFSAAGAGYDYLDFPSLDARGIVFTNGQGAGNTATSDIGLFLILSTFRLTSLAEWGARSGNPDVFERVHCEVATKAINPCGRILGAVGLGAIQKEIVKKAGYAGLGMKVIYYDILRASTVVEEQLQAEYVDSLDELARRSDCVSISVPYSAATHHIVDSRFISLMRPGTRIVNTSRGRTLEEAALVEALQSGHLLSAGLDVHYNEPMVSPELIALKNVTLLAHIGGVAQDTHQEFERLCLENLDNFLRLGLPLLTQVKAPTSKP